MSTQTTTHVLQLTRTIKAPREAVFRAWTEPRQMSEWAAPEGMVIPLVEVDLKVGGSYRIRMRSPEGQVHNAYGTYREITPPAKVAYTWRWEEAEHDCGETLVTVEFRDFGDATEVVLLHELFRTDEARASHEQGWTSCLNRIEQRFQA